MIRIFILELQEENAEIKILKYHYQIIALLFSNI